MNEIMLQRVGILKDGLLFYREINLTELISKAILSNLFVLELRNTTTYILNNLHVNFTLISDFILIVHVDRGCDKLVKVQKDRT